MHYSIFNFNKSSSPGKQHWPQIIHVGSSWHLTEIFTGAAHFSNYICAVHTSWDVFIIPAFTCVLPSCVHETEQLIFNSSSLCHKPLAYSLGKFCTVYAKGWRERYEALKHILHFGWIIYPTLVNAANAATVWCLTDLHQCVEQKSTRTELIIDNELFAFWRILLKDRVSL